METIKSKKKRQIEIRETRLLEKAGEILMNEGLTSLSMERLAEELATAK